MREWLRRRQWAPTQAEAAKLPPEMHRNGAGQVDVRVKP